MKSLFGNLLAHKFIVTIAAVCTLSVTTAAFVVPNILLQKDAEVENNVPLIW